MPSLVDLKGSGRGMERGRCNQSNHRVVLRLRLHSLLLLLIKNCDSFGPQKVVDCQQQARKSGRGINWRVSAAVRKVIIIRQAVLTRHTRTRPHWIRPHTVRGIGNEEEGGGGVLEVRGHHGNPSSISGQWLLWLQGVLNAKASKETRINL